MYPFLASCLFLPQPVRSCPFTCWCPAGCHCWCPSAPSEDWVGSPNAMGPLLSAITLQNALQSPRLGCVYTGLGWPGLLSPELPQIIKICWSMDQSTLKGWCLSEHVLGWVTLTFKGGRGMLTQWLSGRFYSQVKKMGRENSLPDLFFPNLFFPPKAWIMPRWGGWGLEIVNPQDLFMVSKICRKNLLFKYDFWVDCSRQKSRTHRSVLAAKSPFTYLLVCHHPRPTPRCLLDSQRHDIFWCVCSV